MNRNQSASPFLILSIAFHAILIFGVGAKLSSQKINYAPDAISDEISVKLSSIVRETIVKPKPALKSVIPKKKIQESEQTKKKINNYSKANKNTGRATILAKYLSEVRALIEKNKFYPRMAKRLKHQGTVTVVFEMSRNGSVTAIKSVDSRFESLGSAVEKLIKSDVHFPPFPSELSDGSLEVKIPVSFELI